MIKVVELIILLSLRWKDLVVSAVLSQPYNKKHSSAAIHMWSKI